MTAVTKYDAEKYAGLSQAEKALIEAPDPLQDVYVLKNTWSILHRVNDDLSRAAITRTPPVVEEK